MTEATRWWWVRHAPAVNPDGAICGSRDLPADLSDTARLQALADILPGNAVWVTTGLCRARDTCAALSALVPPDRRIVVEDAFREQGFGDWEGLRWDEIPSEMSETYWADPVQSRAPGGESFTDLVARVVETIDRLHRSHARPDIVVIGHAGPIRAAIAHALGGHCEAGLAFHLAPLSLTRIDAIRRGGSTRWRISGVNLLGDYS